MLIDPPADTSNPQESSSTFSAPSWRRPASRSFVQELVHFTPALLARVPSTCIVTSITGRSGANHLGSGPVSRRSGPCGNPPPSPPLGPGRRALFTPRCDLRAGSSPGAPDGLGPPDIPLQRPLSPRRRFPGLGLSAPLARGGCGRSRCMGAGHGRGLGAGERCGGRRSPGGGLWSEPGAGDASTGGAPASSRRVSPVSRYRTPPARRRGPGARPAAGVSRGSGRRLAHR